ncbi:hypothetical protein FACS1894105_02780 [Clostridia bacterium]|nr:hypothetical protein FACS1894105_02780 [Clostridia bacterium]
MIYLKNVGHIDDIQNLHIVEVYNSGENELNFDIAVEHEYYCRIIEESSLAYGGQNYIVKSIDEQGDAAVISCRIDLDDLCRNAIIDYVGENQHLYTLLNFALTGTGWSYTNAGKVASVRTTELAAGNALDLLRKAQESYRCVFRFDTANKNVDVFPLNNFEYKGVYFTDELNIDKVLLRGDSFDFCTRLIPIGTEGLRINSINGGISYVENHGYSGKIITKVWKDDSFTDVQSLKDEAIEKLKILSNPNRTYSLDVIDLASVNSEYTHLKFAIGDKVMLVDRNRNARVEHQVAKLTTYPDDPRMNKAELAATAKGFENIVKNLTGLIDGTNVVINIQGRRISKLTLDVEAFNLELSNYYTKGETETYIGSQIIAESGRIDLIVSEQVNRINNLSGEVEAVSLDVSELSLTVGGFATRITNAEGNISTLAQSAVGFGTRITSAEGGISTLNQTVTGFGTRITTAEGNISTITQTANKISWLVASGTSSANFTLTDRAISLVASTINLTGFVTINSLSTAGQTTINAGNITTGTIDASVISVKNLNINDVKFLYSGTAYDVILCKMVNGGNRVVVDLGWDYTSGSAYKQYDLNLFGSTITIGDTNPLTNPIKLIGSVINIGNATTFVVITNGTEFRPSAATGFYLGTSSYPWQYGYFTNATIAALTATTITAPAIYSTSVKIGASTSNYVTFASSAVTPSATGFAFGTSSIPWATGFITTLTVTTLNVTNLAQTKIEISSTNASYIYGSSIKIGVSASNYITFASSAVTPSGTGFSLGSTSYPFATGFITTLTVTTLNVTNLSQTKIEINSSNASYIYGSSVKIGYSASNYITFASSAITPSGTGFALGTSAIPWATGFITTLTVTTLNVTNLAQTKIEISSSNASYIYGSSVKIGVSASNYVTHGSSAMTPSGTGFALGTSSIPWGTGFITTLTSTTHTITTSTITTLNVVTQAKIGSSTSATIGFYGTTPTTRKTVAAVATSATLAVTATGLSNLLIALKAYGLIV